MSKASGAIRQVKTKILKQVHTYELISLWDIQKLILTRFEHKGTIEKILAVFVLILRLELS